MKIISERETIQQPMLCLNIAPTFFFGIEGWRRHEKFVRKNKKRGEREEKEPKEKYERKKEKT